MSLSILLTTICNNSWFDELSPLVLCLTTFLSILTCFSYYSKYTTALKQVHYLKKKQKKNLNNYLYTISTWSNVIRYINNFNKVILPGLVLMFFCIISLNIPWRSYVILSGLTGALFVVIVNQWHWRLSLAYNSLKYRTMLLEYDKVKIVLV